MRKIIVMLSSLSVMAVPAHAEHKLLITDMLSKGQSEVSAAVSFSHSKYDFSDPSAINPSGTARSNSFSSSLDVASGLGGGFQISASIPYLFSEKTTYEYETSPPTSQNSKHNGPGDLTIGTKYFIVGEEKAPVTLVAGIDIKFDMQGTKHGGTGTTNLAPYIAMSRKFPTETRVYTEYTTVLRNHGAADSHVFNVGVEQVINSRLTAVAEGIYIFYTNNQRYNDTQEFGAALAAYLQLHGNLYLIPSLNATQQNVTDRKDASAHFGNIHTTGAALALYYLF